MASKSKKRRRVLGASCILAALIIAGSSFAWFTSKDEVTNRLTASSDYGVSIVESFTPPKNWVPGQKVNKDVYAVNTGNIDAFVEEEVSGLLTYSYEVLVDKFGVDGVPYEELGLNAADEAESKEAGGYLIWNNAGAENGAIGKDWSPTVSGDYIFRRAIDPDNDEGGQDVSAERYTLEGYHYDGTANKYYKIKIGGNDDVPSDDYEVYAADGTVTYGNRTYVEMNDAGTALKTDPVIKYYALQKETAKPVGLTYREEDGKKWLEAAYTRTAAAADSTSSATYGMTADEAEKIVTNANIVAKHDGRLALYNLGNAQITAINTVQNAADNVRAKAQAYVDKYDIVYKNDTNEHDGTQGDATAAGEDVHYKTASSQYTLAVHPTTVGTDGILDAGKVFMITAAEVDDSNLQAEAKEKVKKAITNYSTAEGAYDTAKSNLEAAINAIYNDNLITNGTQTAAEVTSKKATFDSAATAFYNAAKDLRDAYANVVTQTHDSGLITAAADSVSMTSLNGIVAEAKKMSTEGEDTDYRNALDALLTTYIGKAGANETAISNMDDAYANYLEACNTYNSTLNTARGTYDAKVAIFDEEKLKSNSTNDLTATAFDNLVAQYADNALVTEPANNYTPATAYAAANIAKLYNEPATAASTQKPEVIGADSTATDTDVKGQVSDTNYQGTVQTLGTQLTVDAGSDTTNEGTYNYAKTYLDKIESDKADADAAAANQEIVDQANVDRTIKIKINLDDKVNDATGATWSLIPEANGETVAHFYLNSILPAGVTSDKLIDSVELDGEATLPTTFKDMTFDLNVALKSAQVTYDENNNVLATAADSTFTNAKVNGNDTTRVVTITDGKIGWTQVTTP